MANGHEMGGDPNETIAVYTTNDLLDAEIVRNALRTEGMRCELDSQSQGGFVELVEIKVLVSAADADRARRLIAHHRYVHGGGSDRR